MNKVLRGLLLVALIVAAVALYALRAGWLTRAPDVAPVPVVAPSASTVASASVSPTQVPVVPTPSPLPTRDRRVLRVAVDDRAGALLFQALPQYIKNHGGGDLKVTCVVVPSAAERWQMLAAGSVDFACGSIDSWVLASSRHDAGVVLFKTAASAGFDALVARDTRDMASLKGKRVAVVGGEGGIFLLGYFLDSRKMLPSQVHTIDVEDPHDALQLLQSGRVQAACLWQPYVSLALRDVRMTALATTASRPLLDEVCVVNRSFLSDRQSDVTTFVRYWFEQIGQLQVNGGWGSEMIARDSGRSASEVAEQLKAIRLYTLADNRKLDVKDIVHDITHLQDFWRVVGVPNANRPIDAEHSVKIQIVQDIEVAEPSPIYGTPDASSSPSARASAAPSSEASPEVDESGEPQSSPEESPSPGD